MKSKLFVTDEAEREIEQAFDWYETKAEGLGERLLSVIDETLDHIVRFPHGAPVRKKDFHEYKVQGFPYLVIYRIVKKRIVVYQLFHLKRNPAKKIK